MSSAALPDQATLPIFRILMFVQVLAAGFFGFAPFLAPDTFASCCGWPAPGERCVPDGQVT